jgi:alginate O-acetyltransferase complex protein AlgI
MTTFAATGVSLLSSGQPGAVRMVVIIATTLVAIKSVVLVRSRNLVPQPLRIDRWLTFIILWPGMRPELFISRQYQALTGVRPLLIRGTAMTLVGIAVLAAAHGTWMEVHSLLLSTTLALVGISLLLHFGFLVLLTGVLRAVGADVTPLFVAPLMSSSLREFWGKRWNIAFTEMTSRIVFRPMAGRIGASAALALAFLFSGLLHELAISVPVGAGYGLPLLYFVVHGTVMIIERRREQRGLRFGKLAGHIWVISWLVLPLPLLFHPWFLSATVWPLFGAS